MIDWAEVNFVIGTNPDSFIEIKFDTKSIDTELIIELPDDTLWVAAFTSASRTQIARA